MPTFHRTPHTIKSLTLRLSLAEGVEIGDLQGKRYRITVPLNGLVFDNHSTTPAWFYAVFPPQLGSGSVPVPAGIRLTGSQPVMSGADSGDPRQAIVSRLTFDMEFTADAVTFAALPLVVKGFAAATNAPASFSLPAFTPSPDAPFVVTDADGGALAAGITVEELSIFAGDSELLEGENGTYYLNRTNHTGTQAMSTVTGLGSALDELAQATLPPGGSMGQVLAKTSATHYDADWVNPTGGGSIEPVIVQQTGHGLDAGDFIKVTGNNTYAGAQADSAANAEVAGRVSAVSDADNFEYLPVGPLVTGSGWTAGEVQFLSTDSPGATTSTQPGNEGEIVKPALLPLNATQAILLPYIGYAVPGEDGGGFGGDADTLQGEDGGYYLDRSNHTGTQALSTISDAGTAAALNVATAGNAATGEVVKGNDSRLTDARTPTAHNHDDRYYTEGEIDALLEGFEPGGGGGIEPVAVDQSGHGLSVGDYIKVTGNDTYAKAQADSAANAEIAGRVSTVTDSDNFKYLPVGLIVSGSGWTAGEVRFLDPATPGATTATPPSTEGQIVKPVLLPINATEAILLDYVGYVVPGESGETLEFASQEEAEEGTATDKAMSPLRTAQAIAAQTSDGDAFAADMLPWYHNILIHEARFDALSSPGGLTGDGTYWGQSAITTVGSDRTVVVMVPMSAGEWKLTLSAQQGSNAAIVTIALDDDVMGTLDFYHASATSYNIRDVSGVMVEESKVVKIVFDSSTKNASSSGYWMTLARLVMRRTA